MNKIPSYNWQAEPQQCKSEVEEMYLPKPGHWLSIPENNGVILINSFEETIFVSSQIKGK